MCEDNPRDVTRPRCNWGKVLVLDFKYIVIAILIVFLLVLSSVIMIMINCGKGETTLIKVSVKTTGIKNLRSLMANSEPSSTTPKWDWDRGMAAAVL